MTEELSVACHSAGSVNGIDRVDFVFLRHFGFQIRVDRLWRVSIFALQSKSFNTYVAVTLPGPAGGAHSALHPPKARLVTEGIGEREGKGKQRNGMKMKAHKGVKRTYLQFSPPPPIQNRAPAFGTREATVTSYQLRLLALTSFSAECFDAAASAAAVDAA